MKQTQRIRILNLLKSKRKSSKDGKIFYGWVELPEILKLLIASHTRRIHELRKVYNIELKKEWKDGVLHTKYRLWRLNFKNGAK